MILQNPLSSHHSDLNWITVWSDFPSSSDGIESACSAGDLGLIPGLGRSPGEGTGNPPQYSCLENPKDRGAWQVTVHGVTRVRRNLVSKPPPPPRHGSNLNVHWQRSKAVAHTSNGTLLAVIKNEVMLLTATWMDIEVIILNEASRRKTNISSYYLYVKSESESQACLTLCDPIDYTVPGMLQARILEWVAYPFSRGSS